MQQRNRRRALLESIFVSAATLFVVGAGILGLWLTSADTISKNYRHYLTGLAVTAATMVDPALQNSLRRPEQLNDPDYLRAVEPLRRMRAALPDIHYIYTVVFDGTKVRFVLDAAQPGAKTADGVADQSGVWEAYDGDPRDTAMLQALGSNGEPGFAAATEQPLGDKWGQFMTGWAPLFDQTGKQIGAIGVDVDAGVYVARLHAARQWALLGLAPAVLLIALLGAALYRIRLRGLDDAHAALESAAAAERAAGVLAEERKRLAAVIEGTNVGTWEWDLGADAMAINERWAAMLGYRLAELAPLSIEAWRSLVHAEDLRALEQAIAVCLSVAEAVLVHEFRMQHKSGAWVWILARGRVMERDAERRPLRMAGIHLDVSARKTVELSLKESESKFRSLFELSPAGIALNDVETGQFLQVNDALLAPTGYSREELLQMRLSDITPASHANEDTAQLEMLELTGRYGPYEKVCRRKDGSTYSVLLSGIRMRDESGRDIVWSIVQDISHRKAMELELAEAARRDKLTGLANRALFMERLQQAVERVRHGEQSLFAVLFLDFDRFKLVNDTLGHEAGDELLRQIAERLRGALRAVDLIGSYASHNLVARFGGDEFLILINDLTSPALASRLAERLLNSLAPVYNIFGSEVHSTASVGIVTSEQCHASAEEIVRNADVAMYEAKRSGRACSVVFNEAMHTRLTRHVAIEANLRRAIDTPELYLVYQPIVDLQSGRIISAEALVRWNHPTLGAISPSEFIPIAEESNLIVALGQRVQREACEALKAWRERDPAAAPQTISINVSRVEMALGGSLLEQLRAILHSTGLPAHCLQLEVTERGVMRNPEASLELMHELRRLGVRLAMDDFGTGTSSLGFLQQCPFDTIKIDRSFVKNLSSGQGVQAVIRATVNLIENLGMTSLAEGVEEPGQAAILRTLGCRYAQGYLFSRPVSADQLLYALETEQGERPRAVMG